MAGSTVTRGGLDARVGRALLSIIAALQGHEPLERRAKFEARFLAGACLLALVVAVLSIVADFAAGDHLAVAVTTTFVASLVFQLGALKLGASTRVLSWTLLATVGAFLAAVALIARPHQHEQLFWLALFPLAAQVLVGPRSERQAWLPRVPLVATLAAAALGVLVLFARGAGLAPPPPLHDPPEWRRAVDFVLFILSTGVLAFLYDLSAREERAEPGRRRRALSMCGWCRRILDEDRWVPLERFLVERQQRDLVHGMCPGCYERAFPELASETRPPRT